MLESGDHPDLQDQWAKLNEHVEQRKGKLGTATTKLDEFHNKENENSAWLEEQHKIIDAMNEKPISLDDKSLETQTEDWKSLENEVNQRRGDRGKISSAVGEVVKATNADHESVRDALEHFDKYWDNLEQKLQDRNNLMERLRDEWLNFKEIEERIRSELNEIPPKIESAGNQQSADGISEELEALADKIKDLEACIKAIAEKSDKINSEHPDGIFTDLNSRHQKLKEDLNQKAQALLAKKAEDEQKHENLAIAKQLLHKLQSKLSDNPLLVSAQDDKLEIQFREFDQLRQEVADVENKVKELSGDDANQTSEKMSEIKASLEERKKRLDCAKENHQNFSEKEAQFRKWLEEAESRVEAISSSEVIMQIPPLQDVLRQLELVQNEAKTREAEFDNAIKSGGKFVDSCDADREVVNASLKDLKQRWKKLKKNLEKQAQHFGDTQDDVEELNIDLEEAKYNVAELRDRFEVNGNKSADEMSGLLGEVEELRRVADKIGKKLTKAKERNPEADDSVLAQDLEQINDGLNSLQSDLEKELDGLKTSEARMTDFDNSISGLDGSLESLKRHIFTSPVSANEETLQNQTQDNDQVLEELKSMEHQINTAVEKSSEMDSPRQQKAKQILELWNEIRGQAKERQTLLKNAATCVATNSKLRQEFKSWLDQAEDNFAEHDIVPDTNDGLDDNLEGLRALSNDIEAKLQGKKLALTRIHIFLCSCFFFRLRRP